MRVDICYSPAQRSVECLSVDVLEGTLLGGAIPVSLAEAIDLQALSIAVWGRVVGLDYTLQAGDRVELVRKLRVDPMTARRERFRQQGAKKAGLFKTKRTGAKQGY